MSNYFERFFCWCIFLPCCFTSRSVYRLAVEFNKWLLTLYYNEISIFGLENIPLDKPIIFVMNHSNGLVDGQLVFTHNTRRVFFLGKEPLFRIPVFGGLLKKVGSIPVFRQEDNNGQPQNHNQMFSAVYDTFADGECIGIAPEGTSHDDPELMPLKIGVSVMAFGALERGVPVTLVPVGVNFISKASFRSQVLVEYGKPFEISPELIDLYHEYRNERRNPAVSSFLKVINQKLREVTINTPDWKTYNGIRLARRIFQPANTRVTFKEYIELQRLLATQFTQNISDPTVSLLKKEICGYMNALDDAWLADEHVLKGKMHPATGLFYLIKWSVFLGILLPLTLPFVGLNFPIVALVYMFSEIMRRQEVKDTIRRGFQQDGYQALDSVASQRLVCCIVFVPIFYVTYAVLFAVYFPAYYSPWGYIGLERFLWFIGVMLLLPICSWLCLTLFDMVGAVLFSMRSIFVLVFRLRRLDIKALRAQRRSIQVLLRFTIGRLLPVDTPAKVPVLARLLEEISEEENNSPLIRVSNRIYRFGSDTLMKGGRRYKGKGRTDELSEVLVENYTE